jgi:hypothetical protein
VSYRPADLGAYAWTATVARVVQDRETSTVIDIAQRRADRLRVMNAIYEASGGSEHKEVLGRELAAKLGLTDQDLGDACRYLAGNGLIKIKEAMNGLGGGPVPHWINITHWGIQEIEQSLQVPDKPTEHFPPAISVIEIHGDVIGSAIQSGSPGAQQDVSVGDISLYRVREILTEFEAQASSLHLPDDEAAQLHADMATVKAQVESPRPNHHTIREHLLSARAILEHAAGGAAAVGLLDLLRHVHL